MQISIARLLGHDLFLLSFLASRLRLRLMINQRSLGQETKGVAALMRAASDAVLTAEGAHRHHLLAHVINLSLEHFAYFVQLGDVAFVIGSQTVEQVAHVVPQTSDHLLQLVPAALD